MTTAAKPQQQSRADIVPGFGQLVRQARERAGWSQAELAAFVGVSQGAVARIENEEAAPSLRRALDLLRVLGIPAERLGRLRPKVVA